ncbi:MAG: methyltransferase domain-containing protein [Acidobacteriota bacterium]|nr:methyltransferase domain-containing protein [Acidobacteriota bacterium]MDH3785438.1 methyltransferase domain-containing protein [Acidobacteriota bacterium]
MHDDRNPQYEQMADESMVRGLRGQADAIWPHESRLLDEYDLPDDLQVLDVGCGTGEFIRRLGEPRPGGTYLGIDLIKPHLEIARQNCVALGDRARFMVGDAFDLDLESDRFDLTVNRHMLQSIPTPERVVSELIRVTRPGGRLHLLVEDYAMIHFHPVDGDTDRFFHQGAIAFGRATGTDLRIGRRMFTILRHAGLTQVDVQYVTVDTLRTPREVIIRVWKAWRDGYTDPIARETELSRKEIEDYWSGMLDCLENPDGYAVWQIPIITGVKPG